MQARRAQHSRREAPGLLPRQLPAQLNRPAPTPPAGALLPRVPPLAGGAALGPLLGPLAHDGADRDCGAWLQAGGGKLAGVGCGRLLAGAWRECAVATRLPASKLPCLLPAADRVQVGLVGYFLHLLVHILAAIKYHGTR